VHSSIGSGHQSLSTLQSVIDAAITILQSFNAASRATSKSARIVSVKVMTTLTMKLQIHRHWTGLQTLPNDHSRIVLLELRMVRERAGAEVEAELREQATAQASTMYSHPHPAPLLASPRPSPPDFLQKHPLSDSKQRLRSVALLKMTTQTTQCLLAALRPHA
jgi:hypothetical protein